MRLPHVLWPGPWNVHAKELEKQSNAGFESERLNEGFLVGPSWLKSPTCCRVNVDLCFSFGAVGNLIGVVHFLPAKVTSLRSELPFADVRAPLQSLESGRECS